MYDEYLPELANSKEEDVQVGQCKPAGFVVARVDLHLIYFLAKLTACTLHI